jgi:hypothetical protein
MTDTVVLPADVYDALELSCEVFGGIGAHALWDDDFAPFCIAGQAMWLDCGGYHSGPILRVIEDACGGWGAMVNRNNDTIRQLTHTDLRRYTGKRVSWQKFAKAAHIVRGDS